MLTNNHLHDHHPLKRDVHVQNLTFPIFWNMKSVKQPIFFANATALFILNNVRLIAHAFDMTSLNNLCVTFCIMASKKVVIF